MARRSRQHRHDIPGYDESRPNRLERKKQHRATRHAANQILNSTEDPEEVVLPEERRTRLHETNNGHMEPKQRRFKVWKTKFWKRRDEYKVRKAELDADWPVVIPEE